MRMECEQLQLNQLVTLVNVLFYDLTRYIASTYYTIRMLALIKVLSNSCYQFLGRRKRQLSPTSRNVLIFFIDGRLQTFAEIREISSDSISSVLQGISHDYIGISRFVGQANEQSRMQLPGNNGATSMGIIAKDCREFHRSFRGSRWLLRRSRSPLIFLSP